MGVVASGYIQGLGGRAVHLFFLRWVGVLLYPVAEQFLGVVSAQHSMGQEENDYRAFLYFLLWKVCYKGSGWSVKA